MRKWPAIVAVCMTLAALGAACGGDTDASVEMPALALDNVDGSGAQALDDIAVPAVVNLWATWCAPCKAELPMLEAASQQTKGAVSFVGVNLGDDPGDVAQFVADTGVTYPQLADPDGEVSLAFDLVTVPVTLFVDPDGAVTVHNGVLSEDQLDEWIAEVTDGSD